MLFVCLKNIIILTPPKMAGFFLMLEVSKSKNLEDLSPKNGDFC